MSKGTNWKQKFQKHQNENICLTNLNMENKRNFPILSFDDSFNYIIWLETFIQNLALHGIVKKPC